MMSPPITFRFQASEASWQEEEVGVQGFQSSCHTIPASPPKEEENCQSKRRRWVTAASAAFKGHKKGPSGTHAACGLCVGPPLSTVSLKTLTCKALPRVFQIQFLYPDFICIHLKNKQLIKKECTARDLVSSSMLLHSGDIHVI